MLSIEYVMYGVLFYAFLSECSLWIRIFNNTATTKQPSELITSYFLFVYNKQINQ